MFQPEDMAYLKDMMREIARQEIKDALDYEKYLVNIDEAQVVPMHSVKTNNTFTSSITESMDCWDILNWYRNLYYKESKVTEEGIMAWAIDDCFKRLQEVGFFK
jgi:hypothetical protein